LDNHQITADFWNVYLSKRYPGIKLTPEDVCFMNDLQKTARMVTTGKITRDGLVDKCGYTANVEIILDERARREAVTAALRPSQPRSRAEARQPRQAH
jgi:hypothetical protein